MEEDVVELIHLHVPALVNRTEKWLKAKANSGWKLIGYHHCVFKFRKCNPCESEYLYYSGFGASKGLSFDYHMIKKKYGKSNSELNKLNIEIFEADVTKIDSGYFSFIKSRNSYFLRHYIALLVFWILALIYTVTVTSLINFNIYMIFLSFVSLVPLMYSFFSTIILVHDITDLNN